MNHFGFGLLVFAILGSCTSQIESATGAVERKTVEIPKDGGRARVELRILPMTIGCPDGNRLLTDVLIVRDPESGLVWWRYQTAEPGISREAISEFMSDFKLYRTGEKIVAFTFSSPFLWVRESKEHFSSDKEGEAAIAVVMRNQCNEIRQGFVHWFRQIAIGKALGTDFLHLRNSASPFPQPMISEVSNREGVWHVVLNGPNKDRAEVVLDAEYQVIKVVMLPAR